MISDEGMIDFKLFWVMLYDRQTDICDCRVAFVTEKYLLHYIVNVPIKPVFGKKIRNLQILF